MSAPRFIVALFATLLLACAAKPVITRYYVLNAQDPAPTPVTTRRFALAVGPITVPDHLDQPLIVTRPSDNVIAFNEYHRWANPLGENIAETLIARLGELLPQAQVAAFPASPGFDYEVRCVVEIVRLDGTPGGSAKLIARWRAIDDKTRATTTEQRFEVNTSTQGALYRDLVAAKSAAVSALGDDIARFLAHKYRP